MGQGRRPCGLIIRSRFRVNELQMESRTRDMYLRLPFGGGAWRGVGGLGGLEPLANRGSGYVRPRAKNGSLQVTNGASPLSSTVNLLIILPYLLTSNVSTAGGV